VTVIVVGQVAALAHEAAIRHVVCQDHGEEIEAATLLGGADDHCGNAHWVGVEGAGGEHEDCAIVHALRQSSIAPHGVLFAISTTIVPPGTYAAPAPLVLVRARYRIAPKTSPPRAG